MMDWQRVSDLLADLWSAQRMLADAAEQVTYASLDLRNLLPWPDENEDDE
jgi:hypothetical protein